MQHQPTKYIYTVGENIPARSLIILDGNTILLATNHIEPTESHSAEFKRRVPLAHLGISLHDFKQGDAVVYDPSNDTADISHSHFDAAIYDKAHDTLRTPDTCKFKRQ